VVYFCFNTYDGFTAVLLQFSRIGNDPGAAKLLEDLDQDPDIGEFISTFSLDLDFELQMEDKWFVVCQP